MARRSKKKQKKSRRSSSRGSLSRMSISDLMNELDRRKSALMDQRDELQNELDDVNQQIAELDGMGASNGARANVGRPRMPRSSGGGMRGRRAGRGGNSDSLPVALHRLLQGRTMGVAEMADAVQKAGYRTTSPNFRTIVNAALLAKPNSGLFKKVARGQYTAK